MQVKKQQLELDMEQWTGSKLGKEYVKAVYCHPAYLTYAEYIMWNARLDEAQAEIEIARKSIKNLICRWHHTYGRSEEELKSPLMRVKEESENAGWLKTQLSENKDHGIWSHHFMASRWGNNGNSDRLYLFWGGASKITADGDCSHDIKRLILIGRKAMTKLDSILKCRHYFADKGLSA